MKIFNFKIVFFIWLVNIVITMGGLVAQEAKEEIPHTRKEERGIPFIEHYLPSKYNAYDQNWTSLRDSLGIMYFGNADGVLVYDGIRWDLISLPNQGAVFSLDSDSKGRVFVGAAEELGYLEPDSAGKVTYHSLLSDLERVGGGFSLIRDVFVVGPGVFYCSPEGIFHWNGNEFDIWEDKQSVFLRSFLVNGHLMTATVSDGIWRLTEKGFKSLTDSDFFKDKEVVSILPYDNKRILIGTYEEGLFLWDGNLIQPFRTELDEFLQSNGLNRGILLSDSTYALGTLQGGIAFLDKSGRQKLILNGEDHLEFPRIFDLYQDHSDILWAAMNGGIAKIEYPSPYSVFNKDQNLQGTVDAIKRFDGKLYVGTTRGLFVLNSDIGTGSSHFEVIKGMDHWVSKLLEFGDQLLIGTEVGIFQLKNTVISVVSDELKVYSMTRSKLDSNRIFVGHTTGVNAIYYQDGKWIDEGSIPGLSGNFYKIIETLNGDLWIETNVNHIYKVVFNSIEEAKGLKEPTVLTYGTEDGLPDDLGYLYYFDDQLRFSSVLYSDKIFRYDSFSDSFVLDTGINELFGESNKEVEIKYVDQQGNIWVALKMNGEITSRKVAWKKGRGKYQMEDLKEARILHVSDVRILYENIDHVVWYGGKDGLIQHDLAIKENRDTVFNALIRNVIWNGDSILFSGLSSHGFHYPNPLPIKQNSFRFQFSGPHFRMENSNQFKYFLEGYDTDWSDWSFESQKDYTNLPEGEFTFRVLAKNIFGQTSREDQFSFVILPPWYRTWWAYSIAFLLIVFLVSWIIRWRSYQLKNKNLALEAIVKKRTLEISQQKRILETQTKKLRDQTSELKELDRMKNHFFANITHEFRTPLTVILGMADDLQEKASSEASIQTNESLNMIRRNGENLLKLVNEMLDLAKLENGNLQLKPVQVDVIALIKYLCEGFQTLAKDSMLTLTVYQEVDQLLMDVDPEKLSTIISNLLSNAIKFTSPGGKIILHLNVNNKEGKKDLFVIKVKDTGIGMDKNVVSHIFDRFYQEDTSAVRRGEGTGIGLALTKELVNLMKGSISVKSTLGTGSEFVVTLPVLHDYPLGAPGTVSPGIQVSNENNDSKTYDIKEELANDENSVLVIEDNMDVSQYLNICLKGKYEMLHASDGVAGLEMAFERMPDIIICDVMMPKMDGYEVCKTLKGDDRTNHIPIIMLTAKASTEDRLTGLMYGADAYLVKPFVKAELFTRLDQLVLQRQKMIRKFESDDFSRLLRHKAPDPGTQFLQNALKAIHNAMASENFGSAQLARELHLSESQLYRKLKALSGKSVALFIRFVRLQKAREEILTTNKQISEIAYDVGFSDPSWFSRAFREEFGYTPSDLRK